ncbi:hypothetical protein F2P81_002670 [Scophthalmus maximus]|uniref:Uncharacterized protein n=1 Tax=Scophthalmus maximus TaxID=52904 RepID=A0A6A4TTX4_SCOMX|nr:hypothetical protein F2P81_002670 [Scophthalmus maximus]
MDTGCLQRKTPCERYRRHMDGGNDSRGHSRKSYDEATAHEEDRRRRRRRFLKVLPDWRVVTVALLHALRHKYINVKIPFNSPLGSHHLHVSPLDGLYVIDYSKKNRSKRKPFNGYFILDSSGLYVIDYSKKNRSKRKPFNGYFILDSSGAPTLRHFV